MKKLFTKKSIKIFVAIVIIILLQVTGILGLFKGLLARFATPIFSHTYEQSTTVKKWIDSYKQPTVLIERNSVLEKENALLMQQIHQQNSYNQENERLKSILEYQDKVNFVSIPARVISRWEYGGEKILTINRGSTDGAQTGDLVIDEKGVLVGKLSQVDHTISHVQLMTHPDFKLAVKRSSENTPLGIMTGEFLISANVDLIPQDAEISIAEELLTTNLQNGVEGIRVGKVTEIISEPGDLFKSASVDPLFTLDNIIFLQIVKHHNND